MESRKLSDFDFTVFRKPPKLKCREIWPLQIREIQVWRKFYVIT